MGSKRRIVDPILAVFPEHVCYVEVFGGGGSVLLAKPTTPFSTTVTLAAERTRGHEMRQLLIRSWR